MRCFVQGCLSSITSAGRATALTWAFASINCLATVSCIWCVLIATECKVRSSLLQEGSTPQATATNSISLRYFDAKIKNDKWESIAVSSECVGVVTKSFSGHELKEDLAVSAPWLLSLVVSNSTSRWLGFKARCF